MNVQDVFTFAKLLAVFIIIAAGVGHMVSGWFLLPPNWRGDWSPFE